jgi:hypothetical protein
MNLDFLNYFKINELYKDNQICYIDNEIWSTAKWKKEEVYIDIKLTYFAAFDRGVGNWNEFDDYLKYTFPNLETLILNQNYTITTIFEPLEFITNSWIKNILIFDSQTSCLNDEFTRQKLSKYDINKFYYTPKNSPYSSYISFIDTSDKYIHIFCVLSGCEYEDHVNYRKFRNKFDEGQKNFLKLDPYKIVE